MGTRDFGGVTSALPTFYVGIYIRVKISDRGRSGLMEGRLADGMNSRLAKFVPLNLFALMSPLPSSGQTESAVALRCPHSSFVHFPSPLAPVCRRDVSGDRAGLNVLVPKILGVLKRSVPE
ncbi:hypothetical protein EVAR_60409_1 [Eumeta japonica]|uniref:Uncharacterized protein n=1 Tax=Eumeta variegata TaxID=151549 RepID=A0A4C1YTG7_EUMVA|nr:hypothetical protein EVAR_60409_1 [Eumeta japonica]